MCVTLSARPHTHTIDDVVLLCEILQEREGGAEAESENVTVFRIMISRLKLAQSHFRNLSNLRALSEETEKIMYPRLSCV